MIQIIPKLDLTKTWGKGEKTKQSIECNAGIYFTVILDKGEYLGQVYKTEDINIINKLESLHGQSNIVVISKNVKGGEKDDHSGFHWNDQIVEVMTLQQYVKKAANQVEYVPKFVKYNEKKVKDDFIPPLSTTSEMSEDAINNRG
jgi:hypothetical protein